MKWGMRDGPCVPFRDGGDDAEGVVRLSVELIEAALDLFLVFMSDLMDY